MDKLLDILTRLEYQVDIEDGVWREWMLSLIYQAMDISAKGKAHKWPEEKPEGDGEYLVRCVSSNSWNEVVYWRGGCFFTDKRCLRKAFNEAITHWWHLPEV